MSSTRTHTKAASLFILLFVFIAVIPSMVSAAKRMCTLSDRVSPDSCPKDFKNMCAFFSGKDCDSKTCQRLANNECTACLDPNVLYYFDQPCPGDKIYCDSTMRPTECPVEDSPVCAFTEENCVGDSCKKTASSGCQACQDPSVLYYNPYECPVIDEKFYCDVFDFASKCAETDAKPVCAYFTEQCDKEICSTTVYTSCEACLDPFVLYYKVGECEEELDPRKYCLPGNRPTECISNNDEPVCGFYGADCEGEVCIKDYQSKCSACQDGLVSYFIPGSCDGNILAKEASMMEMIPSAEAKNMDRVFQQEGCMGCDGSDNVNDSFGFISEEETFFGSNHD